MQFVNEHSSVATILRDVGGLQVLIGGAMMLPLLVSLLYGEVYPALAFLLGGLTCAGIGGATYRICRDADEPERHHATVIAGLGWFVTACLGALPFIFVAYLAPESALQRFVPAGADYSTSLLHFRNPLHALFESMSGYTTTGLTMSIHEPSVGHGFLFYRSLMQWLGGAGMLVLSLAILRQPRGTAGLKLYEAEGRSQKIRPNIAGTARAVWRIYLGLTLTVAVYLAVVTFVVMPEYGIGPTLFDAINHAMTGQSTGGFSTLDDSIAGYNSYAMELAHVPPMILGAISLPVYYVTLFEGEWQRPFRDVQARMLAGMWAVGVVLLTAMLLPWTGFQGTGDIVADLSTILRGDALRDGLFQYISALSTTGWQTSAIGDWPDGAVMFIVLGAMVIGGSAGATVGGFKIMRLYVLVKGIAWEVKRTFLSSHAVVDFDLEDRSLSKDEANRELRSAAVFILLYAICLVISLWILVAVLPAEFTLADAIFEVATAQGTVGLSSGVTGPEMPVVGEVLFIFQMWIGRLEIIPVLVLIRTIFLTNSQ